MSDNKQLQNALEIATMAHKNVIRRNGDPYIFHVLRVAKNVRDLSDVVGGGQIVTLGGSQGFHSYHLEKVEDFDIV